MDPIKNGIKNIEGLDAIAMAETPKALQEIIDGVDNEEVEKPGEKALENLRNLFLENKDMINNLEEDLKKSCHAEILQTLSSVAGSPEKYDILVSFLEKELGEIGLDVHEVPETGGNGKVDLQKLTTDSLKDENGEPLVESSEIVLDPKKVKELLKIDAQLLKEGEVLLSLKFKSGKNYLYAVSENGEMAWFNPKTSEFQDEEAFKIDIEKNAIIKNAEYDPDAQTQVVVDSEEKNTPQEGPTLQENAAEKVASTKAKLEQIKVKLEEALAQDEEYGKNPKMKEILDEIYNELESTINEKHPYLPSFDSLPGKIIRLYKEKMDAKDLVDGAWDGLKGLIGFGDKKTESPEQGIRSFLNRNPEIGKLYGEAEIELKSAYTDFENNESESYKNARTGKKIDWVSQSSINKTIEQKIEDQERINKLLQTIDRNDPNRLKEDYSTYVYDGGGLEYPEWVETQELSTGEEITRRMAGVIRIFKFAIKAFKAFFGSGSFEDLSFSELWEGPANEQLQAGEDKLAEYKKTHEEAQRHKELSASIKEKMQDSANVKVSNLNEAYVEALSISDKEKLDAILSNKGAETLLGISLQHNLKVETLFAIQEKQNFLRLDPNDPHKLQFIKNVEGEEEVENLDWDNEEIMEKLKEVKDITESYQTSFTQHSQPGLNITKYYYLFEDEDPSQGKLKDGIKSFLKLPDEFWKTEDGTAAYTMKDEDWDLLQRSLDDVDKNDDREFDADGDTVFHKEGEMFEVDGSDGGWGAGKDERFKNVGEFMKFLRGDIDYEHNDY